MPEKLPKNVIVVDFRKEQKKRNPFNWEAFFVNSFILFITFGMTYLFFSALK